MAKWVLEKTFTGTGVSNAVSVHGRTNVLIYDGAGTVKVERSFDRGATWKVISKNADGDEAAYTTASAAATFNSWFEEPEEGVLYRFNCTAHSSGSIVCRMSQ